MPRFLLSSNQNRGLEMKMRRHASSCVLRSTSQMVLLSTARRLLLPERAEQMPAIRLTGQTRCRRFLSNCQHHNSPFTSLSQRGDGCEHHNRHKALHRMPTHPQRIRNSSEPSTTTSKQGQDLYYYCFWRHHFPLAPRSHSTLTLRRKAKCRSKV